jgi:Zn-dependent protease
VGNFTGRGVVLALEMLAAVLIAMTLREYARARAAASLGDPTPRLWGRVTLRTKPWFDPFGSGLIPVLIALLWSLEILVVPAAYAKPAPIDASYLRRQPRDTLIVSLAGPLATLALAIVAGLGVRASGIDPASVSTVGLALTVLSYTSAALFVFHLLPIPGLDGGRIVALMLPPNIREAYRNFDRYLPLMVLLVIFLVRGLAITLLDGMAGAVCTAAAGVDCHVILHVG